MAHLSRFLARLSDQIHTHYARTHAHTQVYLGVTVQKVISFLFLGHLLSPLLLLPSFECSWYDPTFFLTLAQVLNPHFISLSRCSLSLSDGQSEVSPKCLFGLWIVCLFACCLFACLRGWFMGLQTDDWHSLYVSMSRWHFVSTLV